MSLEREKADRFQYDEKRFVTLGLLNGVAVSEVLARHPGFRRPSPNAQEAITLWIETARERGDSMPEPKGCRLILA